MYQRKPYSLFILCLRIYVHKTLTLFKIYKLKNNKEILLIFSTRYKFLIELIKAIILKHIMKKW